MTDPSVVSSPRIRRILSLKNKSKSTVSIFDSDDKPSHLGVSGDHGPKTSEVYGFVGSISTVVATVLFFIWAYVPESWLSSAGIYNYPNSREPTNFMPVKEGEEHPIEPISDIGIDKINNLMFNKDDQQGYSYPTQRRLRLCYTKAKTTEPICKHD